MKVSTSLASLLRQPAPTLHSTSGATGSLTADSARSSGGAPSNAKVHVHAHFGLGQGEFGLRGAAGEPPRDVPRPEARPSGVGSDVGADNQGVRKRLAALDRMVSSRLEAFAERYADLDANVADDVDQLSRDFHANLRAAYDTYRETGDRSELMRTLRGALGQARDSVRFLSATLPEPAGSGGVLVVDPGQAPDVTGDVAGDGEAGDVVATGSGDGSTTVNGPEGSGVTVEVTDLPPEDDLAVNGSSSSSGGLEDILAQIVAQFGDMLTGIEDLIDSGFGNGDDDPGFKLAINLYAEFQVGGTTLGELLDAIS